MPRLLIEFQLVAYGLSPVQFTLGQVRTQLLKSPIVMVPDIGIGLSQLFSNLGEGIALKKMQPQGIPLFVGKRVQDVPPPIFSKQPLDSLIIVCA